MPAMSKAAQFLCRSAPWRLFSRNVVLPWALQGQQLRGDVLEIGCGSGAMGAAVLRNHPLVQLTATDVDPSMVEAARGRLAAFGQRADVRQADATALPFADGSFDVVLSFIMLHHVVQWERAFDEMARVLRPNGRLIGYDLLGDGVGRVVHRGDHSTRPMHQVELRRAVEDLAGGEAAIRPTLGGLVVRFAARKAAA